MTDEATTQPSINPSVSIFDDGHNRSRALAISTGLRLTNADTGSTDAEHFTLRWVNDKLALHNNIQTATDVCIDFTKGRAQHRLKFGGGHGQEIARAVKTREHPLICDATAGLGRDAFVFASLGCQVILLEQSVVVHALLDDALRRAREHTKTSEIAERMQLYKIDSTTLPGSWPIETLPQVIYLDPMYPDNKRTAKKEIQLLRTLLDDHDKEEELLQAACRTAPRVVVKRPRRAPPLAQAKPSGNIVSANTRYDIYAGSPEESSAR